MNDFIAAEPFPHVVLDELFAAADLRAASAEFDTVPTAAWHHYEGPDERGKRACNDWASMGPTCRRLLAWLTGQPGVDLVAELTGMALEPDPLLYGGGLHATAAGGFLGLHLDNERHPQTGFARRLNLIVYCTEGWKPEWGGHLEFWDRGRSEPAVKITPWFGRVVIFETGNHSYHGHTQPLACPPDVERRSLAVYYWSPPRARARFLSPAGTQVDRGIEAARIARSM